MKTGRPDALSEARDLMSLLGALSREGDMIDAETISARMGISHDQARKLLNLVLTSGSATQEYLPLSSSDDSETLLLISDRGVRGRPLRLTQQESIALVAALNTLGVPQEDPIRSTIHSGFDTSDINVETITRTLAPLDTTAPNEALVSCVDALLSGCGISFSYRGLADDDQHVRHVIPQLLRHLDGHWYLDAFDLDRQNARTFRVDRMQDVHLSDLKEQPIPSTIPARGKGLTRLVELIFHDKTYLTLFDWPGLEVLDQQKDCITARIPYYNNAGTWLIRRIAACAGTVTTGDRQLASAVAQYARDQLQAAVIPSDNS